MTSLFNQFGSRPQQTGMMNGPFGNILNVINQFDQFARQFQGDPKQQVEQLLASGQMSQQQYGQLQRMAGIFQNLLRSR